MSKELLPIGSEQIKKNITESIAKKIDSFLENDDISVSQAQQEAFQRVIDSLPDSKFKELVSRLEGPQKLASKANELIYKIQDKSWNLAKPLISLNAPLAAMIPKDPFSRLAIKTSKLSAVLGEKVVKTGMDQGDKLKVKVRKFKDRKKSKGV